MTTDGRLLRFHSQSRSRVAAGRAGVGAGRIVAAVLDAGPDVNHGIGHKHGGFNDQLPVAGNAVI